MKTKQRLTPGITPIAYLSLHTKLVTGIVMAAFICLAWLAPLTQNTSSKMTSSDKLEVPAVEQHDSAATITRLKVERSQP